MLDTNDSCGRSVRACVMRRRLTASRCWGEPLKQTASIPPADETGKPTDAAAMHAGPRCERRIHHSRQLG